jgi:hypothetical protein
LERDSASDPPKRFISPFLGAAAEPLLAAHAVAVGLVPARTLRRARVRLERGSLGSREFDVHLGAAGALLAFAEMEAVLPGSSPAGLGRRLSAALSAELGRARDVRAAVWATGMAHGLAGAMMALEAARGLGHVRLTKVTRQRHLDSLLGAARSFGRGGLLWPNFTGPTFELGLQSWCAGTPGIALSLLAIHRLSGEEVYLELARGALRGAMLMEPRANLAGGVCCGLAGFGHLYVEAFRITGERKWLSEARRVQARCREHPGAPIRSRSLFKGRLGVAYLHDRCADSSRNPFPGLGALSVANANALESRVRPGEE